MATYEEEEQVMDMKHKQRIKIIRDWFIPWILDDCEKHDIIEAWNTGESIEDLALNIFGLIPIDHIQNWDDIKHHWDLEDEDYPCIHEGFNSWSAYYEDDGYVEHIPETLKVEWVNEK